MHKLHSKLETIVNLILFKTKSKLQAWKGYISDENKLVCISGAKKKRNQNHNS